MGDVADATATPASVDPSVPAGVAVPVGAVVLVGPGGVADAVATAAGGAGSAGSVRGRSVSVGSPRTLSLSSRSSADP